MTTIDPTNWPVLREEVFNGQDITTLNFHPDGTNSPQGDNPWVFGLDYSGDYGTSAPFGGSPYASGRVQSTPDGLTMHVWQNNNGNGTGLHMQTVGADKQGWTFSKGYVEIEAKLPRGVGMWPGFWMLDANRPNDPRESVEVDFLEFYPERTPRDKNYDRALIAWEGGVQQNVGWTRAKSNIDVDDAADNFHTYGFKFDGNEAVFYRDRVETHRETVRMDLLESRAFYLMITLTTEYINAQFTQTEFDALYALMPDPADPGAQTSDAAKMTIRRVSVWDVPATEVQDPPADGAEPHEIKSTNTTIVNVDGQDLEVTTETTVILGADCPE